jgi:hypothetical protein
MEVPRSPKPYRKAVTDLQTFHWRLQAGSSKKQRQHAALMLVKEDCDARSREEL